MARRVEWKNGAALPPDTLSRKYSTKCASSPGSNFSTYSCSPTSQQNTVDLPLPPSFSCLNCPYLASRNFLRRLGRSWLRRRRNQRSTWRPESPLCRDRSSTSAWVGEKPIMFCFTRPPRPSASNDPSWPHLKGRGDAFPFLHPTSSLPTRTQ